MRIRITFKKTEPMRYTSHLDLQRAWGRAIRRANLPLAYSKGFHPQPKINLACALPLGITSEQELVDIWFENAMEIEHIYMQLMSTLPPGIEIISVNEISNSTPALQSKLISIVYEATLIDEIKDIEDRVNAVRHANELIRLRRGKKYDLRPLIESICIHHDQKSNSQVIKMQLTAREGATGRPDEVIDACSISPMGVQIRRVKLVFSK